MLKAAPAQGLEVRVGLRGFRGLGVQRLRVWVVGSRFKVEGFKAPCTFSRKQTDFLLVGPGCCGLESRVWGLGVGSLEFTSQIHFRTFANLRESL